jgi:hypothetical protein
MPSDTNIFIGWDVGGWNCDYNPKSFDARVILDSERQLPVARLTLARKPSGYIGTNEQIAEHYFRLERRISYYGAPIGSSTLKATQNPIRSLIS